MQVNLDHKELSQLVQSHIAEMLSVPNDRLKVSFEKKNTIVSTIVEVLKPGQVKGIIAESKQFEQPDENSQAETEAEQEDIAAQEIEPEI